MLQQMCLKNNGLRFIFQATACPLDAVITTFDAKEMIFWLKLCTSKMAERLRLSSFH